MAISCIGADGVGHVGTSVANGLRWTRCAVARRLMFQFGVQLCSKDDDPFVLFSQR